MKIEQRRIGAAGIRFSVKDGNGEEIGRTFLYLLRNDLHRKPFGLMEDVYVKPGLRGDGIGTRLTESVIQKARKLRCYKLIATSRFSRRKVHELYQRLGYKKHGLEFRIDF